MSGGTPTRSALHFFGGKGGVGKTTLAAAFALGQAKAGRVLLASTDPACSLGDALGARVGSVPRSVAPNLEVVRLDAPRAFARWRATHRDTLKRLAERGTYFDGADLDRFLELSLPGVDELFGLLELTRWLERVRADTVVVDTAPTGHTLRLFDSPDALAHLARVFGAMQEKHHVLAEGLRGFRREDDADALVGWLEERARALAGLLRDPLRTSLHWIALPEHLALEEASDAVGALSAAGIPVAELLLNRVHAKNGGCDGCKAKVRSERAAWAHLPSPLRALPIRHLPALEAEPRGAKALRPLLDAFTRPPSFWNEPASKPVKPRTARAAISPLPLDLPDTLEVLFLGGKGGVGKTTASVATALSLAHAHPERPILLLSVDPAHSLADALGMPIGDVPVPIPGAPTNLRVRELDAARAFERERERLETAIEDLFDTLRGGSRFDASYDRAILRELAAFTPPGIDEVFGLLEVMEALGEDEASGKPRPLLILDTAPTGHALRLLELPKVAHAWVKALLKLLLDHRAALGLGPLAEDLLRLSKRLGALQALWRDPARTRFLPVTRAAPLPIAETLRLRRALARLGIPSSGVLVNALTHGTCARCRRTMREERRSLEELRRLGGRKAAIIVAPAVAPPPRGPAAISVWSRSWETG